MVPMAHGRWLADRVPAAEVVLSSDDGHLTLLEHIDRARLADEASLNDSSATGSHPAAA